MKRPEYRRELSHSYLVMDDFPVQRRDSYQYQMILKNRIPGLLSCSERFLEGKIYLYYEISSRQSLAQLYASGKMGFVQIAGMIDNLTQVLDTMAGYLLEEKYLVLEPEYIYMDLETEQLFFLYYPFAEEKERKSLYLPLAEFFLEHVNHREERAVGAAYQFYKMSKAESFTIGSFRAWLERDRPESDAGGTESIFQEDRNAAENRERAEHHAAAGENWLLRDHHDASEYCVTEKGREQYIRYMEEERGQRFSETRPVPPERTETYMGKGEEEKTENGRSLREKNTDRKRPNKKREKNGRKGAILGFFLSMAILLFFCALVWYLQPEGIKKVLLFLGIAADGLLVTAFLWKAAAADSKKREEWYREEQEEIDYYETVYESTGRKEGRGPRLIREDGEEMEYGLAELPVMAGKLRSKVQLLLDDASVSRIHARFVEKEGKVALIDLNSTNGTFLNGVRLEQDEVAVLQGGDRICLGSVRMRYEE